MDTVKELQHSLSQLIYSIKDIKSLSKIKSTIDKFVQPKEERHYDEKLPWQEANLSMKTITSFGDVVKSQGDKKLTFEELYPYIDESESDYSVDDLLNALN